MFSGPDDSEKLKSVARVTDIWIEESTEITQKDFDQVNLRLRSPHGRNQISLSFNPININH